MAVPILTIPEAAFDPAAYTLAQRRQSGLVKYLLTLTRGSATFLVLVYVIGLFALRPLMETTALQRLDFLEAARGKLRDLYLNVINRVNYIPIVAINKKNGSGKLYADSVCQTEDLQQKEDEQKEEKLGLGGIHGKLTKLHQVLKQCDSFQTSELPHYKVVDFQLKDFRQKTDMVYFNQRELFEAPKEGKEKKSRNLAQEVKTNIRSVKGMFMSGQV